MILIDGMPVYCGGNLYDSDESDWEDPYDIACAEYVDQYNFDALEGMELHVFERINGPDESVMMVSERTGSKHVIQASSGYPRWELDTVSTEPVAHVFTGRHDVPDVAVSPNCRSCSETYGPIGQCGTLSPSDSDAVGLVGPDGSSSNLAGILFPAVPAGIAFPVGPLALLACMGRCPHLTLILWSWWTLVGRCPHPTLSE